MGAAESHLFAILAHQHAVKRPCSCEYARMPEDEALATREFWNAIDRARAQREPALYMAPSEAIGSTP